MSPDPKQEELTEQPTWRQVVKLRRKNLEQEAEIRELDEELGRLRSLLAETDIIEDETGGLRKELQVVTAHRGELTELVKSLEYENGNLERRLARAMGQVTIITENDALETGTKALMRIHDVAERWCPKDVDPLNRRYEDGPNLAAALRAVRDAAFVAMREMGVKSVEKEKAKS